MSCHIISAGSNWRLSSTNAGTGRLSSLYLTGTLVTGAIGHSSLSAIAVPQFPHVHFSTRPPWLSSWYPQKVKRAGSSQTGQMICLLWRICCCDSIARCNKFITLSFRHPRHHTAIQRIRLFPLAVSTSKKNLPLPNMRGCLMLFYHNQSINWVKLE